MSPISPNGSEAGSRRVREQAGPQTVVAYLLLAFAVLCWAGNFVVGRSLRFDVPPVAFTFWRWTVALLVLLPFSIVPWRQQWRAIRRSWGVFAVLALLASVVQHIAIFWGLTRTTATSASLLNSTSPIFIVLISTVFLKERFNLFSTMGILISLVGVGVIVSQGEFDAIRRVDMNSGDLSVLVGTLGWAGYTVCLRWRPPELRDVEFLGLIAAFSVAMLTPLYIWEIAAGKSMHVNASSLVGISYVSVIASVIAYIAWNRGVAKVGAPTAGPFMYLMLLFTPILSMIFLHERVYFYHVFGAVLILSGIYLSTEMKRRRRLKSLGN